MNDLIIDDVYYWQDDMLLINQLIIDEILNIDEYSE